MAKPGRGSDSSLAGWSESMALDLWDTGVDVRLILPGAIETEIWTRPDNDAPLYDGPFEPAENVAAGIIDAIEGDVFEHYLPDMKPIVEKRNLRFPHDKHLNSKEDPNIRCASCHALGDFTAPIFLRRWSGDSVAGLFDLVITTMPQDHRPGYQPSDQLVGGGSGTGWSHGPAHPCRSRSRKGPGQY